MAVDPNGGLKGPSLRSIQQEQRMARRAINKPWPVPAEQREAIMARAISIALDGSLHPSASLQAIRTLIDADRANLARYAALTESLRPSASHTTINVAGDVQVAQLQPSAVDALAAARAAIAGR